MFTNFAETNTLQSDDEVSIADHYLVKIHVLVPAPNLRLQLSTNCDMSLT